MTRVRRHLFVAAGVTDWSGRQVACRHCPLPQGHEVHRVPELSDEQRAAELRRVGERDESSPRH